MGKKIKKILIITTAFLMLPFFAYGAPDNLSMTNNEIQHGQNNVTVTGMGFGTKISSNAAPLRWEPFEDGADGANIDTTGYWSMKVTGNVRPVFSTDYPRSDYSTLSIKSHQYSTGSPAPPDTLGSGMAQFWRNSIGFASTKKAYVSMWVRFNSGHGVFEDTGGYQIKTFRILKSVYDNSGNMTYPALYPSYWDLPAGSRYLYMNAYGNQTYYQDNQASLGDMTRIYPDIDYTYTESTWVNVSMQYGASTYSGAQDATIKIWSQRTNGSPYHTKNVPNCPGHTCYFDSPNSTNYANDLMDALKIEYNFDNVEDQQREVTHYTDDVYVDNSWARVEIGDASTYDNCTHREIQIPSAWSDTGITFTANKGSFVDGQAYLYITDENGTQNTTGYPITLISSGDVTAPASPNGLNVQ